MQFGINSQMLKTDFLNVSEVMLIEPKRQNSAARVSAAPGQSTLHTRWNYLVTLNVHLQKRQQMQAFSDVMTK